MDEQENQNDNEDMRPVTIYELAIWRGVKEKDGKLNNADILKARLPAIGGCGRCGSLILARAACPSKKGYVMCQRDCIDGYGFATAAEANQFMFPEEYVWAGVKEH